jgi:hypothetical protein
LPKGKRVSFHKRLYFFLVTQTFKCNKSNGVLDDIPCGTEINAIISEKLETIQQDHFEYIKVSVE